MTTLMSWLLVLMAVSLSAVTILQAVLAYHTQTRWMRIFSEKQGIPATIMEKAPEPKEPVVKNDNRPRISVPIPAGFRAQIKH